MFQNRELEKAVYVIKMWRQVDHTMWEKKKDKNQNQVKDEFG